MHEGEQLWECAVMVTDAKYPLESIGQFYRGRAYLHPQGINTTTPAGKALFGIMGGSPSSSAG